jgi:hypothetical protein
MKQRWNEQELIQHWTLTEAEKPLLEQRTERGRLGLAVLLKFFQIEGRFPLYHKEAPLEAIDFIADQLGVPVALWFDYPLKGRSGKRDREQLRAFLGFRSATVEDSQRIQKWLCQEVVPHDQESHHLKAAVQDWCREQRIEPPSGERIDRLINAAVHTYENEFFGRIHAKLSPAHQQQLDTLLTNTSNSEHHRILP